MVVTFQLSPYPTVFSRITAAAPQSAYPKQVISVNFVQRSDGQSVEDYGDASSICLWLDAGPFLNSMPLGGTGVCRVPCEAQGEASKKRLRCSFSSIVFKGKTRRSEPEFSRRTRVDGFIRGVLTNSCWSTACARFSSEHPCCFHWAPSRTGAWSGAFSRHSR